MEIFVNNGWQLNDISVTRTIYSKGLCIDEKKIMDLRLRFVKRQKQILQYNILSFLDNVQILSKKLRNLT